MSSTKQLDKPAGKPVDKVPDKLSSGRALGMEGAASSYPPLVSVILPAYQAEKTILSVVSSVLGQTYRLLELIVINDGSTDRTLDLLHRIEDPRLRILNQRNQGVSVARNHGLREAQGEYIAFIDSDDVWFPEKIETEVATALGSEHPTCVVYSWYYAVDDADRLINLSPPFREAGDILETMLTRESVMLPSTAMIHRRVYETLGGFEQTCYHEDRAYFIRVCQRFPAYPTEKRLVIYRQSMSGRCRSILQDFDQACRAEYSIIDALQPYLSVAQLRQLRDVQAKSLFYRFLMYGFVKEARRLYKSLSPKELVADKKGILAMVTMKTGINFLFSARVLVQSVTRYLLLPWWRWKSERAYAHRILQT